MRRLGALSAVAVLLLCGCRRAGELPPGEVLRRSTAASAQLQSVQYDVTIDLDMRNPLMAVLGKAALHGTLAGGGQDAAFSATVNGSLAKPGQPATTLQMIADVVNEAQNSYVFVHTLAVQPEPLLLGGSQAMLGRWWKIPREGGQFPSQPLTPDPQFLRAQAAVVTVTKDHGLERINGRDAYHYTVAIDPDRLLALLQSTAEQHGKPFDAAVTRAQILQYDAKGDLWIAEDSFLVQRLAWTVISRVPTGTVPPVRLRFDALLRNHDSAPSVTVPADSELFQKEMLLQNLLFLPAASGSVRSSP